MQFHFPHFEGLCPSWGLHAHLGILRSFPKGALIMDTDASTDGVYYIQEGIVDTVLSTHNGPEKVLYGLGVGCVVGEVCCFVPGKNLEAFVKARTDCVLYFFRRETIEGVIARKHPELLLEMIRILSHIERMYAILLQDSLSLDFFGRLCRFLVYLARFKGAPAQDAERVVVQVDVTQNDIAKLLGVHRVTVAKAVKKLKDQGVIRRFTKTELEIADFPRLCRMGDEAE